MKTISVVRSVFVALLLTHSAFGQGSLTPPGAPAPTMKSLDQIEARTIINATNCPGDTTNTFVIQQSGSYYLTGNLFGVTNKNGIAIAADNVTIDLNGFTLSGTNGGVRGIISIGTHRGNQVVNGKLTDWAVSGVRLFGQDSSVDNVTVLSSGNAIVLDNSSGSSISHCRAANLVITTVNQASACLAADTVSDSNLNRVSGVGAVTIIGISGNLEVRNCVVQFIQYTNASSSLYGINSNGRVKDCHVSAIGGGVLGFGIQGQGVSHCRVSSILATGNLCGIFGQTVEDCEVQTVTQTGAANSSNTGISADYCVNSTVQNIRFNSDSLCPGIGVYLSARGCNASLVSNLGAGLAPGIAVYQGTGSSGTADGCNATSCGVGIYANDGCQVQNCSAVYNNGIGIQVGQKCSVLDCNVSQNGQVTTNAAGISADIRSQVMRCSSSENGGDGIYVLGGSRVKDCTAENNGGGTGASAVGSGIHTGGTNSRIEDNHVRDNHRYGIEAGTSDIIIRNSSGGNLLAQYLPSSGANFAPVQSPATATNPLANF